LRECTVCWCVIVVTMIIFIVLRSHTRRRHRDIISGSSAALDRIVVQFVSITTKNPPFKKTSQDVCPYIPPFNPLQKLRSRARTETYRGCNGRTARFHPVAHSPPCTYARSMTFSARHRTVRAHGNNIMFVVKLVSCDVSIQAR